MIKDTLLICSVVISFVLLYRMYVLSQKINNLEEKINVLDTFTQSIFNYISTKEEEDIENKKLNKEEGTSIKEEDRTSIKEEVRTSQNQEHVETEITYSNDNETEQENYNIGQTNDEKLTENFESKEILSEMVSQLKDSLIQNNNESLEKDLEDVSELKDELINEKNSEELKPNELLDLLNNTFKTENDDKKPEISEDEKKKIKLEEDLMNMKMADLKELAKKKNIKVLDQSKKPKKKEVLVMEILNLS
jgi:hypothetical protein